MLTDQHRLLIAAHVDGELSPERRQAVKRLLERSDEARVLFRKLQADARRLQNLPRQTVPADFAERVLSRLPSNDGEVILRMAATRPDSARVLLTQILSAAAVLFVCVGVGLYWVFTSGPEGPRRAAEIAERPIAPVAPSTPPIAEPAQPVNPPLAPPSVVEPRSENVVPPSAPPVIRNAAPVATPAPTPSTPVLTAPARAPVHFEEVVPSRLSLPMSLRSLINAEAFYRLRDELAKDSSHRVEIFCRDPSRVADRLTAGCKDLGVRLVIDSAAQQVQKQRLRQPYLLFCDNLTANEWAVFFHNLGYSDRRAEEKRPGDGIFDQLVLVPLMPPTDQKELLNHIGTDVFSAVSRPAGSSLDKSDDSKSKPRPFVRQALLIPYQPQRLSPFGSKEIKQFLDARQERRDGQVAVVVVIKPL
jgi:hypothetical protein